MHKHELVGITIQQLIEHFKTSPESFEFYDQDRKPHYANAPTICFQPKIQLDSLIPAVNDPNNSHAVVVSFHNNKELACYIFLKAPGNLMSLNSCATAADSVTSSSRRFEKWRSNYRKFKYLRNLIMTRDKYKDNLIYLKKLSAVFPDTMDDPYIFDK